MVAFSDYSGMEQKEAGTQFCQKGRNCQPDSLECDIEGFRLEKK